MKSVAMVLEEWCRFFPLVLWCRLLLLKIPWHFRILTLFAGNRKQSTQICFGFVCGSIELVVRRVFKKCLVYSVNGPIFSWRFYFALFGFLAGQSDERKTKALGWGAGGLIKIRLSHQRRDVRQRPGVYPHTIRYITDYIVNHPSSLFPY